MPRPLRYTPSGTVHHLTFRGNNRSAVFVDGADYGSFCSSLERACRAHGCRVHAYVLMTNHVHLLATPESERSFARVLQTVASLYVRRFNRLYQRSGHLWGGRYYSTVVSTEAYLFTCYRYIESNPVRAGLTPHPGDYPWSSYRANALGVSDRLVTPHERYLALGRGLSAQQLAYRALFTEELSDSTLAEIRDSTKRGRALGSKRFREEVAAHRRRGDECEQSLLTGTPGLGAFGVERTHSNSCGTETIETIETVQTVQTVQTVGV